MYFSQNKTKIITLHEFLVCFIFSVKSGFFNPFWRLSFVLTRLEIPVFLKLSLSSKTKNRQNPSCQGLLWHNYFCNKKSPTLLLFIFWFVFFTFGLIRYSISRHLNLFYLFETYFNNVCNDTFFSKGFRDLFILLKSLDLLQWALIFAEE